MPYLTPENIPGDDICRPLFIPASPDWLAIVSGALTELVKVWNWEQQGTITVQQAVDRMQQMIDTYYAEDCCVMFDVRQNTTDECILEKTDDGGETWSQFADLQLCPPLLRLGSGGKVQVSSDGGETWTDAEVQTPEPVPPTQGYDNKCLGARNAAEVYRLTWSEVYNAWAGEGQMAFGIIAFTSVLAAMIIFPPAVAVVWSLFLLFWELITQATGGEWTDAVTDRLTCIFYCNSVENEDGTLTFNWTNVLADIVAEDIEQNLIWAVIWYLAQIVGPEGTARAASTRSIAAWDCVDCGCPTECGAADLTLVRGGYAQKDWLSDGSCRNVGDDFSGGIWSEGNGWTTTYEGVNSSMGIHAFCDGGGSATIYVLYSSTVNSILNMVIRKVSDGSELACVYHANTNASQGWFSFNLTGGAPAEPIEIEFGIVTGGNNPAGVFLESVQWTDPNP